jgi:hypothetical protein
MFVRSATKAKHVLIRATLGALLGASIYLVAGLFQSNRSIGFPTEFPLDLLLGVMWMALPTMPVALLSVSAAAVAGRAPGAWMIVAHLVLLPGVIVSGTLLFTAYMTEMWPLINWQRGWLAPVAIVASYLLQSLAVPLFSSKQAQLA